MKKYLKQITFIALLIIALLLIVFEMNAITTDGMMKMVQNDKIHWLASIVIVSYLLFRIYTELSKKSKYEWNFIKVASLIVLSVLILMNNFVASQKTTLLAIRLALLFRYVTLLGMVYIVEYYIVEEVIKKYRIVFTSILTFFIVLLFLFTVDTIPILSTGYYFVSLSYLLIVYLNWKAPDNLLNRVRHFSILLITIGMINDIVLMVYNTTIELTFITVAIGIVVVYMTKALYKQRYHLDKLNEIKSLNVQITKLKNENKETETSVTRIKSELSSRFSLKQNYYENLELVIDVLNTNIIIINQSFKVELSYGNAFNYEEVVGLELSKALFDVFSDDAQYFQSVVKKVFDSKDEVRENLFLSLLDQTLTIHNINYNMSYFVMHKHNDEKVIIMHAEVQDSQNYAGQNDHDKEVSEMVTAVVRNADMFFSDLASFVDFARSITSYLNSNDTIGDNIFRILRRVHTFKGVFDQYNMYTTVRGINDIENELFNTLHNVESLTLDQFSRVVVAYDIESVMRTDTMILKHNLGERFFNSKSKISVDVVDFNRVYLDMVDEIGLDHVITQKMEKLKQVDLMEILESYREYVVRIAEDQGKLVSFQVIGDSVKVNRKQFIELFEGLIHILKNSVTHGVEYPDERREANKTEVATIKCVVQSTGGQIRLVVSDDGKGIDVKEIKNRLFIIGKYTIEELEDLSDEIVCNMVIEDGVTSFMTPNPIAGRGVGMGSIKEVVENVNGTIEVKSKSGLGVTYEIIIPLEQESGVVEVENSDILNNLCLQAERLLTKSEKKSTLSSTWYKESGIVDETLLLDVSSFISARSYRDRRMFISADEAFVYQLIGLYGLHLKYKGSNLKVLNEAICMFIEDISNMTIDSLSTEQEQVKLESACIMSGKMFSETCKGHTADVADLTISEGKLRIVVLNN